MLTLAAVLQKLTGHQMLLYFDICPFRLSLFIVFSVADQSGGSEMKMTGQIL